MVRIQIVSDLHLETHPSYSTYDLPATAPYLALLGDIGHIADPSFLDWLQDLLSRWRIVFFLFGNHEAWHMRLSSAKKKVRAFAERMEGLRVKKGGEGIGEFVFLDRTRYDFPSSSSDTTSPSSSSGINSSSSSHRNSDDITILGCTLYSHITPSQSHSISSRFIDFRDMIDWDVSEHNDAHSADLAWLNEQVQSIANLENQENERGGRKRKRKIMILTHYSPTIDPRTKNPRYPAESSVSSGFMTDLSREICWRSESVTIWGYGHTHYNVDFFSCTEGEEEGKEGVGGGGGKRVVANQKGYYKTLPPPRKHSTSRGEGEGEVEGLAFQAGKIIEI